MLKPGVFQGILDNWVHDWVNNRALFWLEFVGILGCIMAATTLALTSPSPTMLVIYPMYMVGSVCLTISSYMRNNGFWVLLNAFFFTIDVVGLTNTLIK